MTPQAAAPPGPNPLRANTPFIALAGPQDIAALEAAIAEHGPGPLATVRVSNPLAAPLSLERLMLQLAPDDGESTDPAVPDTATRLLRAMAARAAGHPALLVVVEHAETLTASALALLQLLPGVQSPGLSTVQVAFHATPAFHTLLQDPRFQLIRNALASPAPPDRAGAAAIPPPSATRHRAVLLGGAALVATAFLAATLLRGSPSPGPVTIPTALVTPPHNQAPPSPTPATVPAAPVAPPHNQAPPQPAPATVPAASVAPPPNQAPPQPASVAVPIPAPQPAASPPAEPPPPPVATEDPAAARARLFREFNAFVETRGLANRLSRSDREALFQEYLVKRQAPSAPATIPQPIPAPDTPVWCCSSRPPRPVPRPGRTQLRS